MHWSSELKVNGLNDDVRIYNRSLSESEIISLMDGQTPGLCVLTNANWSDFLVYNNISYQHQLQKNRQ